MMAIRLLVVFIFTALLTGCDDIKKLKDDADLLRQDIQTLKTDIKLLRGFLMAWPRPTECPVPGTKTNKLCHYKLQVKKHIAGRNNYWVVTVPSELVEKGKTDCEAVKQSNEDLKNYPCIDPKTYKYWEYVVQIDGNVKPNDIKYFMNDPFSEKLIVEEKKEVS